MDHNALVSTGSQIIKNWTGLAFLLILVVGAFLRFAWLGTVRHGYDNAYQIYDAVRLLDGGVAADRPASSVFSTTRR